MGQTQRATAILWDGIPGPTSILWHLQNCIRLLQAGGRPSASLPHHRYPWLHLNPRPTREPRARPSSPWNSALCTGARAVYIIIIIIINPQRNRLERLSPEMQPIGADLPIPAAIPVPVWLIIFF